jgi:hypothetical protein
MGTILSCRLETMGRKSISLDVNEIQFVKDNMHNVNHDNKQKLVVDFENKFNKKYSYKTLIKWANINQNNNYLTEAEKIHQKAEKKCKADQKYYKKNSGTIKIKRRLHYQKNLLKILMSRKLKYKNDSNYSNLVKRISTKYYEVNKRKRLKSYKIAYQDLKNTRLMKAKLRYSSKSEKA